MLPTYATPALLVLLGCSAVHADTPKEFKDLEALMVKALEAYNRDDQKGVFADFMTELKELDTTPFYDALFKPHRKTCGNYKKHTFQKVGSAVAGDSAVLVLDAEFEKKKAKVSANFFKQDGKMRIQAMLIEPKWR